MDDKTKRNALQELYRDVHVQRKEKEVDNLEQKGKEYLNHVEFTRKFIILTFETFLKEILSRRDDKQVKTLSEIQKGFANLERYGTNLMHSPWRKEFHSIKLYSSFFKHEIEPRVPRIFASPILQHYGYSKTSHDILKLEEPINFENVLATAFELFLAKNELGIMIEIANEMELYKGSPTSHDIIESRLKTVGGVNEAKEYLFGLKHISTDLKRIKSDESGQENERKRSKSSVAVKDIQGYDALGLKSRSLPLESSQLRQTKYPESKSSREQKTTSSARLIQSTRNGIDFLTDDELYGSTTTSSIDSLSNAELYGVKAALTVTPHYPQAEGNIGDYETMSGFNDDESCYQIMNNLPKPPDSQELLPPPSYDTAVDPNFPDNVMQEWVMVAEPQKSNNHDVNGTIPGISGLNISENGSQYGEQRGKSQREYALSDSRAKRQRSDILSTRSNGVRGMPTVTYSGSTLYSNDKRGTNAEFMSGYEKRQSKSKVSPEAYLKADQNTDVLATENYKGSLPSQKSTAVLSKRNGLPLGLPKRTRSASSEVMHPPSTIEDTKQQSKSAEKLGSQKKTAISHLQDDQDYLARKESQKISCSFCFNVPTQMCQICSSVCCNYCVKKLGMLPCEGSTTHHLKEIKKSSEKKEKQKNEKSMDKIPQDDNVNNSCFYCKKPSTHECQFCKRKSCNICHHVKGVTDACKSAIGHIFKPVSSENVTLSDIQQDLNNSNICEFCGLIATLICAECHNRVCRVCWKFYKKEHCPATKKDHFFQLITSQTMIEPKEEPWACERCTFSNPPQNKICAMCATSRGISDIEFPKSGSRKCNNCTYGNSEDAKICQLCSCSLDHSQAESYI